MNLPWLPGLAMVFLSAGIMTAGYAGASTRSGEALALPATTRRACARLAWTAGLGQLVLSAAWLGTATGPALVLCAWMTVGLAFVLAANAWPRQSCRVGVVLGLAGLALAASAALA